MNIKLLNKGANILKGKHDFSTFRASSCNAKSAIKKINDVKVVRKGKDITIQFKSKSFLQNQVRSMVGSLKYLSCDEWSLKKFKSIFKSKKIENYALPCASMRFISCQS